MKALICCSLLILGTVACKTAHKDGGTPPVLQEVKAKTLIPEGIAVHPATGMIYLGSLHQDKVVSVDEKAEVRDVIQSGQEGFAWGLGMKFSGTGDTLWACSADGKGRTALFAIDPVAGIVLRKYAHDSARFLNDLVILGDGRIFVTDTEQGAVFILQDGRLHLWLKNESLKWANGIAAGKEDRHLFVASGRYGLQKVGVATKQVSSATQDKRVDYAIDGLVYYQSKLYAAIGWPQDRTAEHRILRYQLDGQDNFLSADTLAINRSFLTCPTTLAVHRGWLFALGNTNLGVYNRNQQQAEKILDSLVNPVVSKFRLR
jgi:sugar lactone lactonase YvrE